MKGHSQHNPSLIGRKNQAKFENDCVLTNGHRIKITQSNLMILVSFSSAGVAWFENVKRYGTFRSQATENPPFRFLWDTRYRCMSNYFVKVRFLPGNELKWVLEQNVQLEILPKPFLSCIFHDFYNNNRTLIWIFQLSLHDKTFFSLQVTRWSSCPSCGSSSGSTSVPSPIRSDWTSADWPKSTPPPPYGCSQTHRGK